MSNATYLPTCSKQLLFFIFIIIYQCKKVPEGVFFQPSIVPLFFFFFLRMCLCILQHQKFCRCFEVCMITSACNRVVKPSDGLSAHTAPFSPHCLFVFLGRNFGKASQLELNKKKEFIRTFRYLHCFKLNKSLFYLILPPNFARVLEQSANSLTSVRERRFSCLMTLEGTPQQTMGPAGSGF